MFRVSCLVFALTFSFSSAFAGGMPDLCDRAFKPKPPPTWGADYVAGVDVHGNKVVSADIGTSENLIGFPIVIPVEIDIAQRYGLSLPPGVEMKPEIFRIHVHSDGDVTYNGEKITKQVQNSCQEYYEENSFEQGEERRHESANPVPSDDTISGQYPAYNE